MGIVAVKWCDNCLGGDTKLECVSSDVDILVSEHCDRFLQFPSHTSAKAVFNRRIFNKRPPGSTNARNKDLCRSLLLTTLWNVPSGLFHIPSGILSNRHVEQR